MKQKYTDNHPPVLFRRPSAVTGETKNIQTIMSPNNMFRVKATGNMNFTVVF
jgi:hypothetical protein